MQKIYTLAMLFVVVSVSHAQQLEKLSQPKMIRNVGEIIHRGEVRGYYYFSSIEKSKNSMITYQLDIVDEDLHPVKSTEIVRSKKTVLIESAYNEKCFGFLFYDGTNNRIEMITYDSALNRLGDITIDKAGLQGGSGQAIDPDQRYLVPLKNSGFISYTTTGGKHPLYNISHYSDSLKLRWTVQAPVQKHQDAVTASDAFQTDKYIGSMVTKVNGKNLDYSLLVLNKKDGGKIFSTPLVANTIVLSPWNFNYDSIAERVTAFGEYYNLKDKELKTQTKGFAAFTLDMKGSMLGTTLMPWDFLSKVAPVKEDGKMDGSNTYIYFHDFIRTDDGKIFAIGEQYKKIFNGSGIAVAVLTMGNAYTSNFHVNVYNLVMFQFSADYKFEKVHFFEKQRSSIILPAGMGSTASRSIAHYVKATGGFDFAFDQEAKDLKTFTTTYVDYDKKDGGNLQVGSITYTPEKNFVTDKMVLTKRSKLLKVLRAKPGYIYIMSYLKDQKQLDIRLEKINY